MMYVLGLASFVCGFALQRELNNKYAVPGDVVMLFLCWGFFLTATMLAAISV